MAATVNVRELNGVAPGTPITITMLYFQTSDQSAQDATNILMKPLAGSYYSFWKTIFLNCESSPVTAINNVKFYSPGSISWTDIILYVGNETPSTYEQALGTIGLTGTEMVAGHSGITAKTAITTYTSGSPKSVSGSIVNPNTGRISGNVILQATIGTAAVAGALSSVTLTWRYDET